MSKPGSDQWHKEIDRVVRRTASSLSRALDKMSADLPEGAAPQMAIEFLVRELVPLQPWFMHLIIEDADVREAYAETVALLPATARAQR
jgi:hypothetical protein